jgi:D-3-phosphoglycerate dehydrogenase / 2-oxoglutarate reductase
LKILHLESYNYSLEKLEVLENEFQLFQKEFKTQAELMNHLSENQYNIIFTRLGLNLNRDTLFTQKNLLFIVTPTTGLNHIDLDYCKEKSIQVISLKGEIEFLATVKSTAEHTWALLLTLVRNIPNAFQQVKNGIWERHNLMANELDQKTIGIIGYGRLGKIIARYAEAFEMKILVNDTRDVSNEVKTNEKIVNIDELLELSDIICLMITYEKNNINFIDGAKMHKMKNNAIFINTSRGEMVDEVALIDSLKNKEIALAATDVLKNDSVWNGKLEKVPEIVEYAKHNDNLIITPHMGGYGESSIRKTRNFITDKFLNQLKK